MIFTGITRSMIFQGKMRYLNLRVISRYFFQNGWPGTCIMICTDLFVGEFFGGGVHMFFLYKGIRFFKKFLYKVRLNHQPYTINLCNLFSLKMVKNHLLDL